MDRVSCSRRVQHEDRVSFHVEHVGGSRGRRGLNPFGTGTTSGTPLVRFPSCHWKRLEPQRRDLEGNPDPHVREALGRISVVRVAL